MASKTSTKPTMQWPPLVAVTAGLLAWLVPGAGHWLIGRRIRAVVLFLTIHTLFWSGMAIGGVFTVDPREDRWWAKAQLCTGMSGAASYYRQSTRYQGLLDEAADQGQERGDLTEIARHLMAKDRLALVSPAAGPARVFTGVAGMLNLLCIIDVVLLAAMGVHGEPVRKPSTESENAS